MKQYLITAWDGEDALERRMNARNHHLLGAEKLKREGNFILGGAMLNQEQQMIGSTMVLQFETEEEFEEWKRTEPYILNKVWNKVEIHPFKVANV
ncbi:MAG: YciI family protein [Pelobium sp.]